MWQGVEGTIMRYRPPAGVRPPQLEGRRTGRPKGSRSHARRWADILWGYEHRDDATASPPTDGARVWRSFASEFPDEVEAFLEAHGRLGPEGVVP